MLQLFLSSDKDTRMEVWANFYLSPPPKATGLKACKAVALEWLQTILYVVVFYLAFTVIFLEAYQIPSGSMEPTLHGHPCLFTGDRVVALKWISRFWPLRRGEIIIFISAEDHETFIVKRLVGLPGDTIKVKPPHVWVNGEIFQHPLFPEKGYTDPRIPRHFTPRPPDDEAQKLAEIVALRLREEDSTYQLAGISSFATRRVEGTYHLLGLEMETDSGTLLEEVLLYEDRDGEVSLVQYLDNKIAERFIKRDPESPEVFRKAQQAFYLLQNSRSARVPEIRRLLSVRDYAFQRVAGQHSFLILRLQRESHCEVREALFCEDVKGEPSLVLNARVKNLYGLDAPFVIPAESYFVMGDNSNNSNDSRFWGPLPASHVLGKAILVFWPIANAKILH